MVAVLVSGSVPGNNSGGKRLTWSCVGARVVMEILDDLALALVAVIPSARVATTSVHHINRDGDELMDLAVSTHNICAT
jgi:hypothetical protein